MTVHCGTATVWIGLHLCGVRVSVSRRNRVGGRFASPSMYTAWFPTLGTALINADRVAQHWGLDVGTRRALFDALEEFRDRPGPWVVISTARQDNHFTDSLCYEGFPVNLPGQGHVDPDTVTTLLDLARGGNETDFRELAAMVGVPREQIDTLWRGTRRRLSRDAARCAIGGGGQVDNSRSRGGAP